MRFRSVVVLASVFCVLAVLGCGTPPPVDTAFMLTGTAAWGMNSDGRPGIDCAGIHYLADKDDTLILVIWYDQIPISSGCGGTGHHSHGSATFGAEVQDIEWTFDIKADGETLVLDGTSFDVDKGRLILVSVGDTGHQKKQLDVSLDNVEPDKSSIETLKSDERITSFFGELAND